MAADEKPEEYVAECSPQLGAGWRVFIPRTRRVVAELLTMEDAKRIAGLLNGDAATGRRFADESLREVQNLIIAHKVAIDENRHSGLGTIDVLGDLLGDVERLRIALEEPTDAE